MLTQRDSRAAGEKKNGKTNISSMERILTTKIQQDSTGARYRKRKTTGIFSAHHFPIGLEVTIALSLIFDRNGHLCFSALAFESTWSTVKFSKVEHFTFHLTTDLANVQRHIPHSSAKETTLVQCRQLVT